MSKLLILAVFALPYSSRGASIPKSNEDFVCTHDIGYHPSPFRCEEVIVCVHGYVFVIECPFGLFWNPDVMCCDLPEHTNCRIATTTTTTQDITLVTETTTEDNFTVSPEQTAVEGQTTTTFKTDEGTYSSSISTTTTASAIDYQDTTSMFEMPDIVTTSTGSQPTFSSTTTSTFPEAETTQSLSDSNLSVTEPTLEPTETIQETKVEQETTTEFTVADTTTSMTLKQTTTTATWYDSTFTSKSDGPDTTSTEVVQDSTRVPDESVSWTTDEPQTNSVTTPKQEATTEFQFSTTLKENDTPTTEVTDITTLKPLQETTTTATWYDSTFTSKTDEPDTTGVIPTSTEVVQDSTRVPDESVSWTADEPQTNSVTTPKQEATTEFQFSTTLKENDTPTTEVTDTTTLKPLQETTTTATWYASTSTSKTDRPETPDGISTNSDIHADTTEGQDESTLYYVDSSTTGKPPVCSENFGFEPSASSCQDFILCSHGIAYTFQCPNGLLWDQENLTCNYPQQVDCVLTQ